MRLARRRLGGARAGPGASVLTVLAGICLGYLLCVGAVPVLGFLGQVIVRAAFSTALTGAQAYVNERYPFAPSWSQPEKLVPLLVAPFACFSGLLIGWATLRLRPLNSHLALGLPIGVGLLGLQLGVLVVLLARSSSPVHPMALMDAISFTVVSWAVLVISILVILVAGQGARAPGGCADRDSGDTRTGIR